MRLSSLSSTSKTVFPFVLIPFLFEEAACCSVAFAVGTILQTPRNMPIGVRVTRMWRADRTGRNKLRLDQQVPYQDLETPEWLTRAKRTSRVAPVAPLNPKQGAL